VRAALVVNADDYAYDPAVDRGILACIRAGRVTATGVMAHAPHFPEAAARLRGEAEVDVGVHLTLTWGEPLTGDLARLLPGGRMPALARLPLLLLAGGRRLLAAVEVEWCAQIERVLSTGLRPLFLNSHEHVHMLPPLFGIVLRLMEGFSIPFVRISRPDRPAFAPGAVVRDCGLALTAFLAARRLGRPAPRLFGTAASGRLDEAALARTLALLRPGEVGELMCHPGWGRPEGRLSARALAYHDWDGERRALLSAAFGGLLERAGVRLVGYRHLRVREGRLVTEGA